MAQIEKIYSVSVPGADSSVKQMLELSKTFDKVRASKIALNKELATASAKGDIDAINKLKSAIAELEKRMKDLSTQRGKATREAAQQAKAEAELARAAREQATAERQRTANLIQQERELDRQIDRETRLAAARERSARASRNSNAEAGSQRDRMNGINELRPFIQGTAVGSSATTNFRGEILNLDQAIQRFRDLSFAEQTFRRQFQQDGTLVGEYSRGIIDAFKRAGLDNLIKGQGDKVKGELGKINAEFARLQQLLQQTGGMSASSFQVLEQQLIQNRQNASHLETELERINTSLQGVGGVGAQTVNSIREGFRGLQKQAAQMVIGFLAFQSVLGQIKEGMADAKQVEGIEAAFKNLNQPDLLANLRAATRGTVTDLELMKQAVQAKNFQIPLDQMATLLDFARRRAKDTGQEVDYLVQSIITGIGRKSPLILDNLGISAVRLKAKFKGISEEQLEVGDVAKAVGQIIQEENAKSGKEVETFSESIARNNVRWEETREKLGRAVLPVIAAVGYVLSGIASVLGFIPWPLTTVLITLFTGALIKNYVATAIASKEGLIYAASLSIQGLRAKATTLWNTAYAAALNLVTRSSGTAAAATTLLSIALKGLGIGLLLTAIAILVSSYKALGSAIDGTTDKLRRQAIARQAAIDVERDAAKIFAEQTVELNRQYLAATNLNNSISTRKQSVQNLIDQFPEYFGQLNKETATIAQLKEGYDKLTESIKLSARVEASAKLAAQKQGAANQVAALLGTLETENTLKGGTGFKTIGGLSDEEIDLLFEDADLQNSTLRRAGNGKISFLSQDFKKVQETLNQKLKERQGIADAYNKIAGTYEAEQKAKQDAAAAAKKADLLGRIDGKDVTKAEVEALIKSTQDQLDKLKLNDPKRKQLEAELKKYQDLLNPPKDKEKEYKGSKLTGQQKDLFKDIDAARDIETALLSRQREENVIGEQTYLARLFDINKKAIDAKLALLKGSNAEERKQLADLQLELITKQNELNQKLFDQNKAALEREKKQAQDLGKENLETLESQPGISEAQKAKAKVAYDEAILASEVDFSSKMLLLEQNYKKQSAQNEKERAAEIRKERQQLRADLAELANAELKDLESQLATDVSAIKKTYAELQLGNTNSTLPKAKKEQNAKDLDKAQTRTVLSFEIDALKKELPVYEQLLAAGFNVSKDYNDKQAELLNKQRELVESTSNDLEEKWNKNISVLDNLKNKLQSFISGITGIKKGSPEDAALGESIGTAVSQAYSLATDAMNGYFDAERSRIEESKKLQIERLELERDQQLARAQSKAEEDSINKQFEAKKRKAEQEAFEKTKDTKKKEAKLALLTEIANIWTSVWKIGNPIAAALMGALFTGLAGARYATTISGINSQKFRDGGAIAPTATGGVSEGPSHANGGIPFNYEAEGGELFVVNKRAAASQSRYTVSGTTKQIASAINEIGGGVRFAGGAKAKRFADGGMLGSNVQAPVFIPSSVASFQNKSSDESEQRLVRLEHLIAEVGRQVYHSDKKAVVQETKTVTDAQARRVKQVSIGTL